MARPPKFGPLIAARCRELLRAGLTCEAVQARLRQELEQGSSIPSLRWINDLRLVERTERRPVAAARSVVFAQPPVAVNGGCSDSEVVQAMATASAPPVPEAPGGSTQGPAVPLVPPQQPQEPLTMGELRAWASTHVRGLQAAVERCERAGDEAGAASARRLLNQAAPIVARITPADREEDGEFVRVRTADIGAAAERARMALRTQLENELKAREGWSVCQACGGRVRPAVAVAEEKGGAG